MAALPRGVLESALNLDDRAHDDALAQDITGQTARLQQQQALQPPTPQWSLPSLDALLGGGTTQPAPETQPQQQAVPTQPVQQEPRTQGWQLPSLDVLLGRDPNAAQSQQPASPGVPSRPFASPGGAPMAMPTTGGAISQEPGDLRAWARQEAVRLGIDPDIAERVAMSEGGFDDPVRQSDVVYQGEREQSYGPYQLNVNGGLGNEAIARGIDPRNPAHARAAVTFALEHAARNGWGNFHGAARVGVGERDGIGQAPAQRPGMTTPPQAEQAQAFAAGSWTPNQIEAATAEGLDYETALAVCGPAAAIAFARKNGRNPTMQEALALAREVGWTAAAGMAGPASQQRLLERMGVASRLVDGAPDWRAVAADVQRGNPVTISTPGHYFVAERYDPESGAFDFGQSAKVLKASGGRTWFRPEELVNLGMGDARATLFIDNPESPTPSIATGDMQRAPLNAAPADAPGRAAPPAPGGVSSAPPGAPPAPWEMPGAQDGGQAMLKAGDDEYDPRLYDEGPRELAPTPVSDAMLPGDGGTAPTPEYDPRQYDEGPRESRPPAPVYADPTIADPSYSEQQQPDPIMGPEQPAEPPSGPLKPLYDTAGRIIGYVQEAVRSVVAPNDDEIAAEQERQRQRQAERVRIAGPRWSNDGGASIQGADMSPVPYGPAVPGGDINQMVRDRFPDLVEQPVVPTTIPGQRPVSGVVQPPRAPLVRRQDNAEEAAAEIERDLPDNPMSRAVSQLGRSQFLNEPAKRQAIDIFNAIQELPFETYATLRRQLISDAEANALAGTDPLAPFRGLGIDLPSTAELNPEGRPASDVVIGLVLQGALPDPADPLVQAGFRTIGATARGTAWAVRNAPSIARAAGRESAETLTRWGSGAGRGLQGVGREVAGGLMDLNPAMTPRMMDGGPGIGRAMAEGAGEAPARRVYHGTNADFERPDPAMMEQRIGIYGPGYYLSDNPTLASDYAVRRAQAASDDFSTPTGANVRAVDVPEGVRLFNLNEPAKTDAYRVISALKQAGDTEGADTVRAIVREVHRGRPDGGHVFDALREAGYTDAEVQGILRGIGYDGLTYNGTASTRLASGEQIAHQETVIFPESLTKIRNAFSGEVGGATLGVSPGPRGASIGTQLATDAGNALAGSMVGAVAPADTPEERLRNTALGAAGFPIAGRLMRRAGGALGTPGIGPNGTPRPNRIVIRPQGWEAASDDVSAITKPGHFYRGMTEDEFNATLGRGGGVQSRADFSVANEGTSFSHQAQDAESYANFGRDDPRKTGRPTYLIEISGEDGLRLDRDGYYKADGPIPTDRITRIIKMEADNGAVVGTELPIGSPRSDVPAPSQRLAAATEHRIAAAEAESAALRTLESAQTYGTPQEIGAARRAYATARQAASAALDAENAAREAAQRFDSGLEAAGMGRRVGVGDTEDAVLASQREGTRPPGYRSGEIPTTRDDTPRSPGLNSAIPGFDPGAAALGAGAGATGEDGEYDPMRGLAGMAVAGILGNVSPRAAARWRQATTRANMQAAAARAAGKAPPPTAGDWLRSIGYSGMIGPSTGIVNAVGNGMELLYHLPKDMARSVARGAPREAWQEARGMLTGLTRAGGEMLDALAGAHPGGGVENARLSQRVQNPIGQVLANLIEAPTRVFSEVPDAFYRSIATSMGESRRAAQIATDEGLKGAQWSQRVNQLLADVAAHRNGGVASPEVVSIIKDGVQLSERLTLRGDVGPAGKHFKGWIDALPFGIGNILVPFFNTPYQMLQRAGERSPVGLRMGTQPAKFDKYYDALVGPGIGLGALGLATGGLVTGSGPSDPEKRRMLQSQGWQGNSTLVGGVWVPNNAFGVFGPLLDTAGEIGDGLRYQKEDAKDRDLGANLLSRASKIVQNQVYLRGFADLIKATQEQGAGPESFAANLASRMIPGGATARMIGNMTDEQERAVDRPQDVGPIEAVRQRVARGLPGQGLPVVGGREQLPPAQDVLGRPVENERSGAAAFGPKTRTPKADPVVQMFIDAGVDIGNPKDEIAVGGSRAPVELSPNEKRRWQALRGEFVAQYSKAFLENPTFMALEPVQKERYLKTFLTKAGDYADKMLQAEMDVDDLKRRATEGALKKKRAS